jgi:hypothetical protein
MKDIKSELRLFHGRDLLDFDLPDEGINVEELERPEEGYAEATALPQGGKLPGMSYKTFWYRWKAEY